MKSWIYFILVKGAILSLAEVLDLGQLDQYQPRIQAPPILGGTTIWISGKNSDGFDIQLSLDAKSKIQGVFDGCGAADNDCYQGARNVLHSADLQIDGSLDRRGFAQLLSKTFKSVGDVFLEISAILYSQWKLRADDTKGLGLFLPKQDATKASALASATVVVISAQGSGVGTVTPTPDPTKLQGIQTPSVIQVTQPSDGFFEGDLAAILDVDLARRIDEVMHLMVNCDDGVTFDAQIGRGPFNDLLLINPAEMPFGFSQAAGEAARAATVVGDFVLAYAPMLAIGDELANQLATYLLALAIDTVVDSNPLKGQNRIAASLVTTSPTATQTPTTTSQTSCPDPTNTPLFCGYLDSDSPDCDVKLPDTLDGDPVCASGKYKDCICNTPPGVEYGFLTAAQVTFVSQVQDAMHNALLSSPAPKPECQTGDLNSSDIPSNVFGSDTTNVYGHFCDSWVAVEELKMTVDAAGNKKTSELQLGRRAPPPPDPSTWAHYYFDLSFEPTDKSKTCALDCRDAYSQMTTACSDAGTPNIVMAKAGKVDVGCGVFDYNIVGPTVPLTLQDRQCYGSNDFGSHGDIQADWQLRYSAQPCSNAILKSIKSSDPSTNIHWADIAGNNVNYQYNIYWKDGCVLDFDPGYTEISPGNPLAVKDPGKHACTDLLIDDYKKCNNGGVGGSIQAGCLVYEFKAQKSS